MGSKILSFCAALSLLALSLFTFETADAASIIIVPDQYPTIQAAINAASPGDTVMVRSGFYRENVTINKSIVLTAETYDAANPQYNTTIIDGGGVSNTNVVVVAKNVSPMPTIRGFVIQNSDNGLRPYSEYILEYNYFLTCNDMLDNEMGAGGIIRGNVFLNAGDDAIDIDDPTRPYLIENNRLYNSRDDSIEIRLQPATAPPSRIEIRITNNEIIGANGDGLQLIASGVVPVDTNRKFVVDHNLFARQNKAGIGFLANDKTTNDFSGADLPEPVYVYNNTFYNNVYGLSGGDNHVAFNNLIVKHTVGASKVLGPAGADSVVAYTLFYQDTTNTVDTTLGPGSLFNIDPQFVALPSAGPDGVWDTLDDNYSGMILKAGSPAIDAGVAQLQTASGQLVPAVPISEFAGAAPDLGWKEYTGGAPIPSATPTATGTVPTQTPTLTPTATHTPTKTPVPSNTPIPSDTPVPSNTPITSLTPIPSPTQAITTLTFGAEADARVEEVNPNSTFGTSTTLRTDGGSDPDIESYLRFTVSGATGPIQRATLRVYATSNSSNGPAVYTTTNNWLEPRSGGITWNTRPARSSSPLDDLGATAVNSWLEFNVTAAISGSGTYSFVLATDTTDGLTIHSRENTNKPQLVVVFANGPLPTATETPIPSDTPVPTKTYTPSPTPIPSDTPTPSKTPVPSLTPTPSNTPVVSATPVVTTLTFVAAADARVEETKPTTNFGKQNTLRVDGGTDLDIVSYLRFTVSGISGPVQRATLRVYATSNSGNGPAAYGTSNTWIESGTGGITWNNRPAATTAKLDDLGATALNSYLEFNVTAFVTGDGTYSFLLATDTTDGLTMNSREGTNKPQLVVELAGGTAGTQSITGETLRGLAVLPTATPLPAPTLIPLPAPTIPPLPALPLVESDSAAVQASGQWTAHDTAAASGGRYLYSSGRADDTLALEFSGTRLDVIYVQHPALGVFAVELDGAIVLTVSSTAPDAVFGARATLGGLTPGTHRARLLPVSGTIAVDAFAVEAAILPTPAPLPTVVPSATPEPPTPLPPATATPQPVALPVFETFDGGFGWTASGTWHWDTVSAHSGAGWWADSTARGLISTLSYAAPVDLRAAQFPQLTFWQQAALAPNDWFAVDVSLDGGQTWQVLDTQAGAAGAWTLRALDLAPYRGLIILLRFRLDTLGDLPAGTVTQGVWLDDLLIQEAPPVPTAVPTDTPPPAPTLWPTDVLPPTVPPDPPTATPEPPAAPTAVPTDVLPPAEPTLPPATEALGG